MTIKADLGFINIAPEVLADIAGYAAMSCFGVKGMTIRSVSDGIACCAGRTCHAACASQRQRTAA